MQNSNRLSRKHRRIIENSSLYLATRASRDEILSVALQQAERALLSWLSCHKATADECFNVPLRRKHVDVKMASDVAIGWRALVPGEIVADEGQHFKLPRGRRPVGKHDCPWVGSGPR